MSVSLIIPTFNRCSTLKRALESVLKQTRVPDEMIVVDDGSTDRTAEMMRQEFPQVDYIIQENQGVSAARNLGIAKAQGDWLAFLDSDDTWIEDKLKKQLAALKQAPNINVCHTEEIWVRKGVRVNAMNKHKKSGGWIFKQCLPLCAMSPSSTLIHRTVFEVVGNFDESFPACEDYDLWLRITAQYPVLFIDQPLIHKYGGHTDQLSHQYWGMDRFRIRALDNILRQDVLNCENKQAAIGMLLKKAHIFRQGALKRGKTDSAAVYQQLIEQYSMGAATQPNTKLKTF